MKQTYARTLTISMKFTHSKDVITHGWHYELKGSDGFNWMSGPYTTLLQAVSDATQQIEDHVRLKP